MKATKRGGLVRLEGRSGNDFSGKFPEVVASLLEYGVDFTVDGEICSSSGDFRVLSRRVHLEDRFKISVLSQQDPVIYHVFDVLEIDGEITVNLPLRQRKQILDALGETGRIRIVRPAPLQELVRMVEEGRLEGVVAKHLNSPYRFERTAAWVKFRPADPHDLPIVGYEESDKPERPFRALILEWGERELKAASGLSHEDLRLAMRVFSKATVARTVVAEGRRRHYFAHPIGHAEIQFTSTPNLPVRFPKVLRIRFDKEVVKDGPEWVEAQEEGL